MSAFQMIAPEALNENVFRLIGKDWLLITAGDREKANTMTASWGCLGVLWNKPIAVCFIRPQRYTLEFVNRFDRLSLSVLPEFYRKALSFCGTKSGRNYDKFAEAGLTKVFDENSTPYIGEARLVLLCKKLYTGRLSENEFLEKALLTNYPERDYHDVIVCEIEKTLVKEG